MNQTHYFAACAMALAMTGCGGSGSGGAPTGGNNPDPAPTTNPVTPPPATGDSAADCFNPELLTPGTRYSQHFDPNNSFEQVMREYQVTGETVFDGRMAIEVTELVSATQRGAGQPEQIAESRNYWQQPDAGDTLYIGSITRIVGNSFDDTAVFEPGAPFSFTTPLDETRDTSYAVRTTRSTGEVVFERMFNSRITYVGRDTVTVPAGTFDTCLFEGNESGVSFEPSRLWIDERSGLVVKQQGTWDTNGGGQAPLITVDSADEFAIFELSFGAINDVPIDQLP